MNGLSVIRDLPLAVDGFAVCVQHPAEHFVADGDGDRRAGGGDGHVTVKAVAGAEHDAAHGVLVHVLGDLHDALLAVQRLDEGKHIVAQVVEHLAVLKLFEHRPAQMAVRHIDFQLLVHEVPILENEIGRCADVDATAFHVVDLAFLLDLVVVQHLDENQVSNLLDVNPRVRHLVAPHGVPKRIEFVFYFAGDHRLWYWVILKQFLLLHQKSI